MPNLRTPVNYSGGFTATDLIAHLQGTTTTICACFYAISELDGSVVAMTSYSSDLVGVPGYPGLTFQRNTGVTASQLQSDSGNAFSQMEASLFLLSAGISEADVLAGKWQHAQAVLFICNYEALNMGQVIMQFGHLAEFVQKSPMVTAEIKGLNNALTAQIGTVTRPECSHDFCDAGCGLDEADYTITGTITGVTSQTSFASSGIALPAGWLNNGKLTFTTPGPAAAATGGLVVDGIPIDGSTLTVNGAVFTFKNSPSGNYQIQIGANADITATNIAAKLNASADPLVSVATYLATLDVVNITYDTIGVAGNSFTLATSSGNIDLFGSTLTGGSPAVSSNSNYVLRIDNNDTATQIMLRTPAPYLPVIGDTFTAVAGCDKRLFSCQNRLQSNGVTTINNVPNRLAVDFSPTLESISRLPAGVSV